jgi:hypothetical protein
MSLQAMTWALTRETGSPSAKVVLLTLANYADTRGCAFPSHKRLAAETEQSEDVIAKRLADLARAGLIYRTRRYSTGDKGGRRTNEYIVLHDEASRDYARTVGWEELACAEALADREAAREEDAEEDDEGEDGAIGVASGDEGLTRESRVNPGEVNPRMAPPLTRAGAGYHIRLEPKPRTIPPPPPRGGAGCASRFDLEFRPIWPWDHRDLVEPARIRFLRLSDDEQSLAVRFAPSFIAAHQGPARCRLKAEDWLKKKGWQAFKNKPAEPPSAAFIFIERGSPQWMAWQTWHAAHEPSALRDGQLVAFQSRHTGKWGRTMRGEWPPASGGAAARDGPRQG